MDLNKILSTGRWGDMAALVNTNFEKIRIELMKLRHGSILTFCKGYFSTEERFLAKFPTGKTGEYAFVGSPWPGTVWEWTDSEWVDSGVAPLSGDGIFMELLKRHIDNRTILWEDAEKYIYAVGGGDTTFTIAVGIDSDSVGTCTVEATGDVVSIVPSDDVSSYTVVANAGGTATVEIVPESGYEVGALTVDNEPKGSLSEYTFERLSANHTMSVKMVLSEEVPTEFLERSDLPGTYYSTVQTALDAVVADYPSGLTQDVTISCIKGASEKRAGSSFLAKLSSWNTDSVYTLTIDGADLLTLNCNMYGGLCFTNVNNVVIRGITFENVANYEQNIADEVSGIMFMGRNANYIRNCYVSGCTMDGAEGSTNGTPGRYAVITKYSENVYLQGNRITNFNCNLLKVDYCNLLTLVDNYMDASLSYIIGHPSLCTISTGGILIAEDNEFTGTTGEYLFSLTNMDRIYFRRNIIHDVGGEGMKMSGNVTVKEFVMESNLMYNLLAGPTVGWAYSYVIFDCPVEHVALLGNTAYVNGTVWQQWFFRANSYGIGTFDCYNNIVCTGTSYAMYGIMLGDVTVINSGHNLYTAPLTSAGVSSQNFFKANGLTDVKTLSSLQEQGVEVGSWLADSTATIFQSSTDTPYKLIASMAGTYAADADHLPAMDVEYLASAASGNNVGAYNLAGTAIDETAEVTGYTGTDFDGDTGFSSTEAYTTLAERVLLLMHNTLTRDKYVKFLAQGSQHSFVALGRYALMSLLPVVDRNGEYVEDEYYDINIG